MAGAARFMVCAPASELPLQAVVPCPASGRQFTQGLSLGFQMLLGMQANEGLGATIHFEEQQAK